MWNPSIRPVLARPESTLNFEEHCSHYYEFYSQYVKQFQIMATAVKEIHERYGMEGALVKGRTTAVKGSLSMTVRVKPTYNVKRDDPKFDIREKFAYQNDYGTEFCFTIDGYEGNYLSVIGLKACKKGAIMLHEIESFPTMEYNKQKIPDWFVETVKDFLK